MHADSFLAHYGIKGMRWGVRRDRKKSNVHANNTQPKKGMSRKKKALLSAGAVLVGVAATGVILKKTGKLSFSDIKDSSKKSEDFIKKFGEEPTSLIWSTRNKEVTNKGFHFKKSGGLSDVLSEYEKSPLVRFKEGELIERYGDDLEKVAVRILDPKGRADAAGRTIPHEFIIPRDLSKDIKTLDDVRSKIWPMVSDIYDQEYLT